MLERDRRHKLKNEATINQNKVRIIKETYDELKTSITKIHDKTSKELLDQRKEIMSDLDKKLEDIKNQLKAEHDRKKEDNYDFKEREKELNDHLDTMTQIA